MENVLESRFFYIDMNNNATEKFLVDREVIQFRLHTIIVFYVFLKLCFHDEYLLLHDRLHCLLR